MNTYQATYLRQNPQLGAPYKTDYYIDAKNIASARKKAREIAESVPYGSLELINVELYKKQENEN